jgi:outer membrane protein assembly factor BamB
MLADTDHLAIHFVNNQSAGIVVASAKTGTIERDFPIDATVQWHALADGKLLTATTKTLAAHDLATGKQLWSHDQPTPYPAATCIVADTVISVGDTGKVTALSLATGEPLWTGDQQPWRLGSGMAVPQAVHTLADADRFYLLWDSGLSCYFAKPNPAGQQAWTHPIRTAQTAPFTQMALTDPYAVILAQGPMASALRAVQLLFINPETGRPHLTKQIKRSTSETDLEGPVIHHWQPVDGGILMEVYGNIYFYHGQ